jgi:hypothetical protein
MTPDFNENSEDGIGRAVRILSALNAEQLRTAVWNRLKNTNGNPLPLRGDEDPGDIFVDLHKRNSDQQLTAGIRETVAPLLAQCLSAQNPLEHADAIGELLRLALHLNDANSIPYITALAFMPGANTATIWRGSQTLRHAALRVLPGLLSLHRERIEPAHHDLFEACLSDLEDKGLALSALVALWGGDHEKSLLADADDRTRNDVARNMRFLMPPETPFVP